MALTLDTSGATPRPTINLAKGQRVNLSKDQPGLHRIRLGLAWDVKDGLTADLDASLVLLDANEKFIEGEEGHVDRPRGLIYHKHLTLETAPGAIIHHGDNRTGDGEGDDETINIDLSKLPDDCVTIVGVITSYVDEGQSPVTFGNVKNAIARVYNDETGAELYKFELSEDASSATALEMVRIYKKDGEWRLTSLGDALGHSANGLNDIFAKYKRV